MLRIRIIGAGFVATIAVTLALSGTQAQTTTSEQAGKPLALLAGLRPPHESKHPLHAKSAHAPTRKTTAKKFRHSRMAAERTRHISTGKTAQDEHRKHAVAATAFAEEPPTRDWPVVNSAPATNNAAASAADTTVAALPESTPLNVDAGSNPTAVKVQTVKITAPNQANTFDLTTDHAAPAAAAPIDRSTIAPSQQIALAAPVQRDESAVGSASWIAQVLAALGGAIAAGAVAWFLIGAGPVQTYS